MDIRYLSPVAGYELPYKDKLIPGAGRPYRRDTTDGIHHGWDILAPFGTPVQTLAKGKVIRVINDWTWGDFKKLKKGNLTRDDELMNLNIFRGNQIWLQTMDGNVTFYSHLSKISPDITVGSEVNAGTYLGNIGISGVPDKNYKDIHLHFEVQQNPFQEGMKNPTYLDIMRWNYIGEYMKRGEIYAKMREIFG
jgi:murein DD-endopeptidase MepM/ murein hydrolase activator NlpD